MIIQADILKWAETYTGPKFHALLSDPPYHLTEVTRRFGKPGSAPAQFGSDGAFQRASKGFMGRDWDGVGPDGIGIAFRPETWAAMAEHLYPGAWGMAFAGSRGWHRMACAIEDAGLIMQPTIFGWSYSTGFPKATRIDTQLDARAFRAWLKLHPAEAHLLKVAREAERNARKARRVENAKELKAAVKYIEQQYRTQAGLTPKIVGQKKQTGAKFALTQQLIDNGGFNDADRLTFDLTHPALEEAERWLGHRYGGQAMKPAIEPIIVFQKPYEGSPLDNITTTGAGALWIDGGRIGATDKAKFPVGTQKTGYNNGFPTNGDDSDPSGRWPANFILSHSPACNGTCAPGCPVARLGAQSGESEAKSTMRGLQTRGQHGGTAGEPLNLVDGTNSLRGHDDTGTAARFFYQADYMYERLELADAIAYVAKASRAEREAGLDPRYTAIMRLLDDSDDWEDFEGQKSDQNTPHDKRCQNCGGWYPKAYRSQRRPNSTCTCDSPDFTRVDFDATTVDDGRAVPIDNPYQRGETTRRNTHPTIKPISLTRYLATLLLPPPEYGPRRLLVPFAGAGSEVIGADLAGWEDVAGVELEADHVAIANARRAYWQQRRWELGDPARKLSVKAAPKAPRGQMDMFVESEVV